METRVELFFTIIVVLWYVVLGAEFIDVKSRRVKMHASCQGKNYCMERPDDYPQRTFEKIWQELDLRAVNNKEQDQIIHRGEGPQINEIAKVCTNTKSFDPIYQILDKEGNVRYVAQITDKFIQKHSVVTCDNPGRVTEDYGGLFALDELLWYNVTCTETKIEYNFLVLSHDGKKVESVTTQGGIPVACICRYRS